MAALADGHLLLAKPLHPGIRIELFHTATRTRRVVLNDEAVTAALSPDQKSLWLNRSRQEVDLWLARLEGPR